MFSKEYFENLLAANNSPRGVYKYEGMYEGKYAFCFYRFNDVVSNCVPMVGHPQYVLCDPNSGEEGESVCDYLFKIGRVVYKQQNEEKQAAYDDHLSKGLAYWQKLEADELAKHCPHPEQPCLY